MRKRRAAVLFAGGGGWSQGAEESGEIDVVYALNHWNPAIQTHKLNFPNARHSHSKIETSSPGDCGKIHLLAASPSCRQHSIGHGNRPIEEQDRAHAWDVIRWLDWHRPEFLEVENVKQFVKWAPLDAKGRPDKKTEGVYFELWLQAIRYAGYSPVWEILNAKDFGAPTDRERFVLHARRGRKDPQFPEPTHGPGRLPYRTAAECIDLSNVGRPIGDRIAESTIKRVEHGRGRFGKRPFLVKYFGTGLSASIDEPLSTLTTKHRNGLVIGDTLRVLTVREMAAAQGFPDDYVFWGHVDEIVKQIGNSVPPPLAKACCRALCG